MSDMTIGKVAREAGVGVETIRFYERRGLLEQPPKPGLGGGFRVYPEEAAGRIRLIRRAQRLGFSLREIDELLSLRADPAKDCGDVRERAEAKLDQVNQKIVELERIRSALEALIAACPGGGALRACSIMDAFEGDSDRERT